MPKAARWYFAATASAFLFAIFIISWSPQLPVQERDVWRIQPRFKFHDGHQKRSPDSQAISIHLTVDGRDIELDFTENELLNNEPPVFLTEDDGNIKQFKNFDEGTQRPKYMQDKYGRAAAMLRMNVSRKMGSEHEIEGVIFDGNDTYHITPMRNAVPITNNEMEFSHEVRRVAPPEVTDDVLKAASIQIRYDIQQNILRDTARVRRTALPTYEVQLLFVLDYSTFRRFCSYQSIHEPTTTALRSAVLQRMQQYFAQLSNLVDLRYRSITTAPFVIRTKLTSIHVATRANQSPWTEGEHFECRKCPHVSGMKTITTSEVLNAFRRSIYETSGTKFRSSVPNFDHAVLFTTYAMHSSASESYSVGSAYTKGICTPASVSLIRHYEVTFDSLALAHELGHSLGAQHDGKNNSCDVSEQFIMHAQTDRSVEKSLTIHFRFSNCSINYFIEHLSSLKNNCLTDTTQRFYPSQLQSYLEDTELANSTDKLCSQYFGSSFRACGGTMFGSTVCHELRCYNASAPISRDVRCQNVGVRVLDGTPCGNKRWCRGGRCVNSSMAREAFDDCPIGNLAENFQVRNNESFVCSDMPMSYCYSKEIYSACCDSCNSKKDKTKPGCEYGDRGNNDNCTSKMH